MRKEVAIAPKMRTFALFTVIVLRWKKGFVTAMHRSTAMDVAKKSRTKECKQKHKPLEIAKSFSTNPFSFDVEQPRRQREKSE